ncbi:putative lipoyltransferase 2, mitochondrial [Varroa jacobsoni]|uniref:Octanoyl-[acyl-carrier-protein]:protein N-octanoyltransferase LIPT2, mitochondrial n=1 Tax=Varroa destructor TaxID=109461 RepID=A0A7M7M8Z2_VARDE|nr:putative lipoyltransferase 2, mitochondrial [Varroa destructor]XP_022689632.1 putative lipoyltransferase 2, mitochondrial [Varroa jacobsoni]
MKPAVRLVCLGRMPYLDALKVQHDVATKIKIQQKKGANPENTLILVEHTPVYTVGIRIKNYGVSEEDRLKKLGADFIRSDRGGLITFHGPGQLVVYPILHLASFAHLRKSVRNYVCHLEQSVIDTCKTFGVETIRTADTGVWLKERPLKIAALGIHCARYVTTHGAAVNCNTDLEWFDHIVPCGLEGKGVTSLSQVLNRNVTIEEVKKNYVPMFEKSFNCQVR